MCHNSILELRSRVMHSNTISKVFLWWDSEKRDLPWRISRDPWAILVSEFMLQQTQVVTVIPYFNRFIKNIPDLETLASFENRKLIKLWEGLGYYSRVRNLKKTAQIVIKDFNKNLPDNILDLKSLPGIGDYTASAIMAIAFNKPIIPLDGNIERVLKRYLYLKNETQIQKDNLISESNIQMSESEDKADENVEDQEEVLLSNSNLNNIEEEVSSDNIETETVSEITSVNSEDHSEEQVEEELLIKEEPSVRRLSLFDNISTNESEKPLDQELKTEPIISENNLVEESAENLDKDDSSENIEPEFNASTDELDEEFNQETEEELLDIPTFLRRQAN